MKKFDGRLLVRFVEMAKNSLKGDWLVFGGTVLPLLGEDVRPTLDIDVAALGWDPPQSEALKLMEIAETLGLPPEAINQAGAYFVRKAALTPDDCVVVAEGKGCRVFRPGGTAYLLLKIPRLSESDLADCLAWVERCRNVNERIDRGAVESALKAAWKIAQDEGNGDKLKRLAALKDALYT